MKAMEKAFDELKSIIISNEHYFYGRIKTKIPLSEKEKEEILSQFPIPEIPNSNPCNHINGFESGEFATNLLVLIDEVNEKKASNNKPYLDLKFSNNKGSFKGKIWSDGGSIKEQLDFFTTNNCCYISGKIDEFPKGSGNKSITVRTFLPVDETINAFDLLPSTDESIEDMTLELVFYLNQLSEPHRSVALAGLKNQWHEFSTSPGAKRHHHAYLGGLLKHTLGLVRINWYITKNSIKTTRAMFDLLEEIQKQHRIEMANNIMSDNACAYEKTVWGGTIDHIYNLIYNFARMVKEQEFCPDLLISSSIWHDDGKKFDYSKVGDTNKYRSIFPFASDIDEYEIKYNKNVGGITMDELGSLVGHMPYGALMFKEVIQKEGISLSLSTIHKYLHCILSHHGKIEWGSPVKPQTPEAIALHFADFLDSRYENYDLSKEKN